MDNIDGVLMHELPATCEAPRQAQHVALESAEGEPRTGVGCMQCLRELASHHWCHRLLTPGQVIPPCRHMLCNPRGYVRLNR